jgi:hypothetical protein
MSDRVLTAVLAAEEATRELPMAPVVYFIIAFSLFVVLLAVTWSFRNTAHKVQHKAPDHQPWHGHSSFETDGTHN